MPKCPVCKTEYGKKTKCPECGFSDLSPVFISKEEGEDLKPYELQIIASYFSLFAASIALYVVLLQRSGEQVVDVENPII